MWGCPAHAVAAPALAGPGRIASHRIVSSCLSYPILAPYHNTHTHKTPRAMLLSLLALCAAPTPPQSAFTPPATQQALPATQPALSASLAAAEAQDGDQTIADAAVQAPAEPAADGAVSNATLGAGVEDAPAQLSSAATSAAGPRALARRREVGGGAGLPAAANE